jgi:hypothetical protein
MANAHPTRELQLSHSAELIRTTCRAGGSPSAAPQKVFAQNTAKASSARTPEPASPPQRGFLLEQNQDVATNFSLPRNPFPKAIPTRSPTRFPTPSSTPSWPKTRRPRRLRNAGIHRPRRHLRRNHHQGPHQLPRNRPGNRAPHRLRRLRHRLRLQELRHPHRHQPPVAGHRAGRQRRPGPRPRPGRRRPGPDVRLRLQRNPVADAAADLLRAPHHAAPGRSCARTAASWLRPDAKSQLTVKYVDGKPVDRHRRRLHPARPGRLARPADPKP